MLLPILLSIHTSTITHDNIYTDWAHCSSWLVLYVGQVPWHFEMAQSQNYPSASGEHDCGSQIERSIITLVAAVLGIFVDMQLYVCCFTFSLLPLLFVVFVAVTFFAGILFLHSTPHLQHIYTHRWHTAMQPLRKPIEKVSKHCLLLACRGYRDLCTTQVPSTPPGQAREAKT